MVTRVGHVVSFKRDTMRYAIIAVQLLEVKVEVPIATSDVISHACEITLQIHDITPPPHNLVVITVAEYAYTPRHPCIMGAALPKQAGNPDA